MVSRDDDEARGISENDGAESEDVVSEALQAAGAMVSARCALHLHPQPSLPYFTLCFFPYFLLLLRGLRRQESKRLCMGAFPTLPR